MDSSRVNVRTSDIDTVFFVRQAARSDSGEYELNVQIENMKDTATIRIQVVGAWPRRGRGTAGPGETNDPGGRAGEVRMAQERGVERLKWGGCEGQWHPQVRPWDWGERLKRC